MHDLGDIVPVRVVIRDADGNLTNATSVTCTITLPGGATSSSTPAPTTTGVYEVDFVTTLPGLHQVRWTSTGPTIAHTDMFNVSESALLSIVSLASARRKCNLGDDTSFDDDLREYMESAREIVESHTCRTIVPSVKTEMVRGNGSTLVLSSTPVASVVSVTSVDGGTSWDVSGLRVNANAGIVHLISGPSLVGLLDVVYRAGDAVVQTRYRRAALIIIEHLFATERPLQVDQSSTMYDDSMGETFRGKGFAIPNRALELLGKPPPLVA